MPSSGRTRVRRTCSYDLRALGLYRSPERLRATPVRAAASQSSAAAASVGPRSAVSVPARSAEAAPWRHRRAPVSVEKLRVIRFPTRASHTCAWKVGEQVQRPLRWRQPRAWRGVIPCSVRFLVAMSLIPSWSGPGALLAPPGHFCSYVEHSPRPSSLRSPTATVRAQSRARGACARDARGARSAGCAVQSCRATCRSRRLPTRA